MKKKKSQINDVTSHIKELQKEKTQKKIKMTKPKVSGRIKITKARAEHH